MPRVPERLKDRGIQEDRTEIDRDTDQDNEQETVIDSDSFARPFSLVFVSFLGGGGGKAFGTKADRKRKRKRERDHLS